MDDLTGTTLGPYLLDEAIGTGGMATVYRSVQGSLNRKVAIKVLPPHFQHDPTFFERFRREATAIAALDHPHIISVHDFGQDDGIAYLVMEYLAGGTIRDLMDGPLRPSLVAELVRQVGSALDYAHQNGIVHRDVKPGNILLHHPVMTGDSPPDLDKISPKDLWVKLADFGLAKSIGGGQTLTRTGYGLGTPEYMSPEQGQGGTVDGRSDQYALGILAFELLTGRRPFFSDNALGLVMAHVSEPPPSLTGLNPDIPQEVDDAVRRALSKNPSERYPTSTAFAEALIDAVAPGGRRIEAPVVRSRRPILIGAGIGTLAVASAISAVVFFMRPAEPAVALECVPVAGRATAARPTTSGGPLRADPALSNFWSRNKERLGEPKGAATDVPIVRQQYQSGNLVLRTDARRFYVLTPAGSGVGKYSVLNEVDRPDDRSEIDLPPDEGLQAPGLPFARIWRSSSLLKVIGWATEPAQPQSSATCQDFQNGFVLSSRDGGTIALLNDSTYLTD